MFCSLPFIIQFLAVKSLIIFNILLSVMLKIWFHSLPSFRGQLRSNLVDKDVANFAQWRYTNQWSYREVVLLLVENWIPIPRLEAVKYHLSSQFLMVFLETNNNVADNLLYVMHPTTCLLGRRLDYDYAMREWSIGSSGPTCFESVKGPSLVQEKKNPKVWM